MVQKFEYGCRSSHVSKQCIPGHSCSVRKETLRGRQVETGQLECSCARGRGTRQALRDSATLAEHGLESSGDAATCRVRYTLTASCCAIISLKVGQPSTARAGPIWSYFRRPYTSRAAKCGIRCSRSRWELVAPPQTDEQ